MKRTIVFSSIGKVVVKNRQLEWNPMNAEKKIVPIENVGVVILESLQIVVTTSALQLLSENNIAVIVCDSSHMPMSQLVPFSSNCISSKTTEAQLMASEATNHRLWKMVVRQKIRNQKRLMERLNKNGTRRLDTLANEVKNGDPSNCEGQAARIYFAEVGGEGFVRDRYGGWPNAPLNYGYAILRAAMARAIVGAGLLCIRGIHHHNQFNSFALADDLMEPYRPFVDQYIFDRKSPFAEQADELSREMKTKLLSVLTCDVHICGEISPLQIAMTATTSSVARYFRNETEELKLPEFES